MLSEPEVYQNGAENALDTFIEGVELRAAEAGLSEADVMFIQNEVAVAKTLHVNRARLANKALSRGID